MQPIKPRVDANTQMCVFVCGSNLWLTVTELLDREIL